MKWTVVLTEAAERDINTAAVWYEGEASDLGRQFLDAVGVALTHIEDNPQQFPVVHRDKRRALLKRLPHRIRAARRAKSTDLADCPEPSDAAHAATLCQRAGP